MKQFTKTILAFLVTVSAASSSWAMSREQALAEYLTTPRTQDLIQEKAQALKIIEQFYEPSALNIIYNKSVTDLHKELLLAIKSTDGRNVTEKLDIIQIAYSELTTEKKQAIEANRKTSGAIIGLVAGYVISRTMTVGPNSRYANETKLNFAKRILFGGHSGYLKQFGYLFDAGSALLGATMGLGAGVGVNKVAEFLGNDQVLLFKEVNSTIGE